MTGTRPVDPLVVVHRDGQRAVRLVLAESGVLDAAPVATTTTDGDVIIDRSVEADIGDATMTWDPYRLAAHTRLSIGTTAGLTAWGFPCRDRVERSVDEPMCLRFHCMDSPFAGRQLSVDLVADQSDIRTVAATGPADLELWTDWDSVVRWLATPTLLFADAFPGLVGLRGEIAVVSMFEGLVWEVTSRYPSVAEPLRRWGRLWMSPAVRHDVARLPLLTGDASPPR